MNMIPTAVQTYIDSHRDAALESLFALLGFPSIANVADPDGCTPCAQWLAEYLAKAGFATELLELPEAQPAVFAEHHEGDDLPTLLIYGHYDVQPADPLELWDSAPFEPEVRDGWIFARGADDDKGQLFTHVSAACAYLKTDTPMGINLKLFIEGEEEIGSNHMPELLELHKDKLAADVLVVSDTAFFAEGQPSITTALRGLAAVEVTATGPDRDLHSGSEGGMVANPINALCRIIASLHDETGRIAIDGFNDNILDPTDEELAVWNSLNYDEAAHAAELGAPALGGGERHLPALVRNWARPTLDCNGITGGYQGPGQKTIIPSTASVKISCRLVPRQDPQHVLDCIVRHIEANTPEGITMTVEPKAGVGAVEFPVSSPAIDAVKAAMLAAFGAEALTIRAGASIPITKHFQDILGLDAILAGVGLHEDNIHSPNEKFKLSQFYGGIEFSARLIAEIAKGL